MIGTCSLHPAAPNLLTTPDSTSIVITTASSPFSVCRCCPYEDPAKPLVPFLSNLQTSPAACPMGNAQRPANLP